MASISSVFHLMEHLINYHVNYWFHCRMCLDCFCLGFLHYLLSWVNEHLPFFVPLLIGHERGSRDEFCHRIQFLSSHMTNQHMSQKLHCYIASCFLFPMEFTTVHYRRYNLQCVDSKLQANQDHNHPSKLWQILDHNVEVHGLYCPNNLPNPYLDVIHF